jgi:uncharacterized Zn-finger protein
MNNLEVCHVSTESVSCKGSKELYDHPVVYLEIDRNMGKVVCPYCSKQFVLSDV